MTVSGSGRRVHQIARLDLEGLGELPDGGQAGGAAALEASDGGDVDVDQIGELGLRQRTTGSPVAQSGRGDKRRARCHRPTGDGSGIGSCDDHAGIVRCRASAFVVRSLRYYRLHAG